MVWKLRFLELFTIDSTDPRQTPRFRSKLPDFSPSIQIWVDHFESQIWWCFNPLKAVYVTKTDLNAGKVFKATRIFTNITLCVEISVLFSSWKNCDPQKLQWPVAEYCLFKNVYLWVRILSNAETNCNWNFATISTLHLQFWSLSKGYRQ